MTESVICHKNASGKGRLIMSAINNDEGDLLKKDIYEYGEWVDIN
jgi:hypothetical protein